MHIAEIIRTLPANLARITSGRIRSSGIQAYETQESMRAKGMHMHLVLPEGYGRRDLPGTWEEVASVITVERANGEVVAILKNRFGVDTLESGSS